MARADRTILAKNGAPSTPAAARRGTGPAGAATIAGSGRPPQFPPPNVPKTPAADRAGPPARVFTERQFRDALAQFATGVTVIAAPAAGGRYVGFTANSFNSVSLAPPLVLWSLSRKASNLATFESAQRYAINVLARDQLDIALRFSRPHADRFDGVPFRLGAAGAPLIEGCVAWFECVHHAQYPAGDHIVFVGEVETCERRSGDGLVFHHGRYMTTQALPAK